MKALVAQGYGEPDVLAIVDRPEPELGPRDVLIEVKAASLNPLDFKIRDGKADVSATRPLAASTGLMPAEATATNCQVVFYRRGLGELASKASRRFPATLARP